jgi:hypothetical protein
MLLDQERDQHSQYGSGTAKSMRIRIRDPKHCLEQIVYSCHAQSEDPRGNIQ